jgi:putative N-acetyltransferase (TIGR04045 family)
LHPGPIDQRAADPRVELSVAQTPEMLAEYYRVRQEVFVHEQGIFQGSDQDEHDANAIPIIALVEGRVAGVVRCYPDKNGVWYGGRLAVRTDYRTGFNLGPQLVRKAVETMERRSGVTRFLATVQIQNVRFFQRLGWVRVGQSCMIQGRKHQLMEKILGSNLRLEEQ